MLPHQSDFTLHVDGDEGGVPDAFHAGTLLLAHSTTSGKNQSMCMSPSLELSVVVFSMAKNLAYFSKEIL